MPRKRSVKLGEGDAAIIFRADGSIDEVLTGGEDDNAENADVMVATVMTMMADEAVFTSYWERTLTNLLADSTEQDILNGLLDLDDIERLN